MLSNPRTRTEAWNSGEDEIDRSELEMRNFRQSCPSRRHVHQGEEPDGSEEESAVEQVKPIVETMIINGSR